MGEVHTRAYQRIGHHYPDPPRPELVAVADSARAGAETAADRHGFRLSTVDWRNLLENNEDYLSCLLRLDSGARATLEASRVSVGEQCGYGIEVHGTKGMLAWDFRRMG